MKKRRRRDNRRIRVLHIIQNLDYGGMERLLADMARHIRQEQFESHILTLQYVGRFGEGLEGCATIHEAQPLPWYSMMWPGPLIRQIREIAPDVVHMHSGVWYKASLAARRAGVKRLVYTEHGRLIDEPIRNRVLDAMAARRTDVVVAVSSALFDYMATTRIAPSAKIRVVPNGVAIRARALTDVGQRVRSELGIPSGAPVIGYVGRLQPIKGPDVLVEAFRQLKSKWKKSPRPVLVLVGDGTLRSTLEAFAERHGMADDIRFLGLRDDVEELLCAFTIFTLASRSEGTCVSLLEAMSAGLCPVVTDVGGNAVVLGGELRHRLVPPENPSVLADAWLDVLLGTKRRRADGVAARRRVESTFGLARMIAEYEKIYADEGRGMSGE